MAPADRQYEKPSEEKLQEIDDAIEAGARINLSECDLRHLGPQLSRLREPQLLNCDLRGVTLAGTRKRRIDWSKATVAQGLADGLTFDRVDLLRARIELRHRRDDPGEDDPERETLAFRRCDLRDAQLLFGNGRPDVHFTGCKLHRAALDSNGPGPHLRFVRTTGLWGFDAAKTPGLTNQENARFYRLLDFPSWAFLKRIGTTRLMSVSWLAVIGLIIYASVLRWYNVQVSMLRDQVSKGAIDASWMDRLGPLPAPNEFGWLILSIGSIAVAATILLWRCPPAILHHTRHEWNLISGARDLAYQGASYDHWWSRRACTVFYTFGGYAAYYLLARLKDSVIFFFG